MNTRRVLGLAALCLCVAVGCRTEGQAEAADDGGAVKKDPPDPALAARPDPAPAGDDEDRTLAAVETPAAEGDRQAEPDAEDAKPEVADGEAPAEKAAADDADAAEPAAEETAEADASGDAKAKDDGDEAKAEARKILILGDSLAATGFGAVLEKRLDARDGLVCYRKGKSASGLARPDFFDWMAEGKRQVELREPELVVVILGGNDGQDLTRRKKSEGRRVRWKSEGWEAEYRARMDGFLGEISAPGRKILWLGLPTMGISSFERKLQLIRRIQKEAVDAAADATYLDTAPFMSDSDGKMLKEAHVGNRRKAQSIRAEDRIHFTMPGSQYFAQKVLPDVLGALGLSE